MTPQDKKKINIVFTNAHSDFEEGLNKRAFFKLSDHALGEELVQDTFMKTWKYLQKGGKIDLMKAFLYHILNNLIIDEYRKHKATSLDVLREKGFDPSFNDVPRMIDKLDGKRSMLLIRKLPLKYQKVILMRFADDFTLEEISDKNGQSKNTNAVQLHRGMEMLRVLSAQ